MSNEGAATLAIDLTATFRAAVRLHQGGRLDEAEANYRAVLAVDPRQRDCLMNLGDRKSVV